MPLTILPDDPNDDFDAAAAIAGERRDNLRAGRAFARACVGNDVDGLRRAVHRLSLTVDGWASSMRAVARLQSVGPDIPAAFLPIWIEKKAMSLGVRDRRTLADALRLLMPRNYAGNDLHLYRGAGGHERQRRLYGFSWTTRRPVAETFAEHWRASSHGGVILETMAPASAVLLKREDEGYFDEGEVVVDPFALGRITVAKRLPPADPSAAGLRKLYGCAEGPGVRLRRVQNDAS